MGESHSSFMHIFQETLCGSLSLSPVESSASLLEEEWSF